MQERSISQRNFLGAFLGGVLGILLCGFLHPYALPIGCIVGVIGGWWYEEIFMSTLIGFCRGVVWTQQTVKDLRNFILTPTGLDTDPIIVFFHACLFMCLFVPIWLVSRPVAIVRWFRVYELRRAYLLKTVACLVHVAINAMWMAPLIFFFLKYTGTKTEMGAQPFFFLIVCVVLPLMTAMIPLSIFVDDERRRWKKRFRHLQFYNNKGPLRFFFKNLIDLFQAQFYIYLLVLGGVTYVVTVGGFFLILIIAPISAVVGMFKGVYRVSTKSGHWLCLVATLGVTVATAWLTYPYFESASVVWTVALANGLASAVVTEGLRRGLVWFLMTNRRTRNMIVVPLGQRLAPIAKVFSDMSSALDKKFQAAYPATI